MINLTICAFQGIEKEELNGGFEKLKVYKVICIEIQILHRLCKEFGTICVGHEPHVSGFRHDVCALSCQTTGQPLLETTLICVLIKDTPASFLIESLAKRRRAIKSSLSHLIDEYKNLESRESL